MIEGFGAPTLVPRPIPYHNGPGRASQVPLTERPFVAWDGEGANLDGPGKPQAYILFGSSDERIPPLTKSGHLHFFECLDYIVRVGKLNPTAFHVSYSFNYDVVQIVRSLPEAVLVQLHKTGKLRISRPTTGDEYFIHYIPSKWFSVTKFGDTYDSKRNPTAKTTVRIYDLFSFFASSFVKAYETTTGNKVDSIVSEGKRARDDFANLDLACLLIRNLNVVLAIFLIVEPSHFRRPILESASSDIETEPQSHGGRLGNGQPCDWGS